MKNLKTCRILLLILIVTLVFTMPLSIFAKSKAIGKPKNYGVSTYFSKSAEYKSRDEFYASRCKGAKKCELFRASSAKGHFSKVATTYTGGKSCVQIKALPGVSFFKVRGINGKKKGEFTAPFVSYCTNISVSDYYVDNTNNCITATFLVDNTKGNCDLLFKTDKKNDELLTEYQLNASESKDLYNETGEWSDEAYQSFKGIIVNETGTEVDSTTIGKKQSGKIFVKYIYQQDDDESADRVKKQIEFASKVFDKTNNGHYSDLDIMMFLSFNINVNGKQYKLKADIYSTKKGYAGYVGSL